MYTSPVLAGPYRPASCRNDAQSSSSRSYAMPRVSARRSAIRYWRTVWRSMSPSVSPVAVRKAWSAAASASVQTSSSAWRRVSPWTSRHVNGRPWPGAPVPPGTVAWGSLDMCAPSFVAAPSVRRPWLDSQALIRSAVSRRDGVFV